MFDLLMSLILMHDYVVLLHHLIIKFYNFGNVIVISLLNFQFVSEFIALILFLADI